MTGLGVLQPREEGGLELSLLTDVGANFSKMVWVFLIEISRFFFFFGLEQDSWEFL